MPPVYLSFSTSMLKPGCPTMVLRTDHSSQSNFNLNYLHHSSVDRRSSSYARNSNSSQSQLPPIHHSPIITSSRTYSANSNWNVGLAYSNSRTSSPPCNVTWNVRIILLNNIWSICYVWGQSPTIQSINQSNLIIIILIQYTSSLFSVASPERILGAIDQPSHNAVR
jgi:hypothetical protein